MQINEHYLRIDTGSPVGSAAAWVEQRSKLQHCIQGGRQEGQPHPVHPEGESHGRQFMGTRKRLS